MQDTKQSLQFTLNGKSVRAEAGADEPLLYVLRNQLNINGPKYGCGLGQCGACMVLIDGQASLSCVVPASTAAGKTITTLAGLADENGSLHPLQQAFIDEQAAQCGYCTNGMIISAASLLKNNTNPGETEIRQALQTNLCRCGTQSRVIRAVKRAVKNLNS